MINRLVVLRTCAADGTSHGGFRWPLTVGAVVEAPDWDGDTQRDCGGGLHGLPWGIGGGLMLSWADDAVWMAVEVDLAAGCIGSAGKCRFRRGTVLAVGSRYDVTQALIREGADASAVVGAAVTATGDYGTATAHGYGGTATANGYRGTATATGDCGTATANGYYGTATATGYGGTATATGDCGTATATGDRGTATANGYGGTATANGYGGTATANGYRGTATAGDGGTISVRWHDGTRFRVAVGYVGEGGIEAGVAYRVDDAGRFVRADGGAA